MAVSVWLQAAHRDAVQCGAVATAPLRFSRWRSRLAKARFAFPPYPSPGLVAGLRRTGRFPVRWSRL